LRSLRGARADGSVVLGAAAGSDEVLGAALLGAIVLGAVVLGAALGAVVLGAVVPGCVALGCPGPGVLVLGEVAPPDGDVVCATAIATMPARAVEAAMVNAFGNFLMWISYSG
jgi:hypothetical protein